MRNIWGFKNYSPLSYINDAAYYTRQFINYLNSGKDSQPNPAVRNFSNSNIYICDTFKNVNLPFKKIKTNFKRPSELILEVGMGVAL